jgi:hypothetical protein|tara:strand:+ start:384 stop:668 length:285 start_codon:yes stop_codon:yes gene_type:complete
MCDCSKENSVVLQNIYLTMAEYKKNKKAVGVRLADKQSVDFRTDLSQGQLAYAYEVLNITDCIDKVDKINKSNEKSTSKKLKENTPSKNDFKKE